MLMGFKGGLLRVQGAKLACGEGSCGACAVEVTAYDPSSGISSSFLALLGTDGQPFQSRSQGLLRWAGCCE